MAAGRPGATGLWEVTAGMVADGPAGGGEGEPGRGTRSPGRRRRRRPSARRRPSSAAGAARRTGRPARPAPRRGPGSPSRARPSRALGVDADRTRAQLDVDGPVRVRAEHAGSPGLDPLDRGRGRMTVRVPGARGDDGDARPDRGQERRRRGGPRAVMGDLEDLDRGQPPGEEGRIDLLLDVAAQEEAVAGGLAEEDDRDVVDPGPAVGRLLRDAAGVRPQDLQVDVVDGQAVPGHEDAATDPARGERRVQRRVARSRPDHPGLEHALDPVPPEQAARGRRHGPRGGG